MKDLDEDWMDDELKGMKGWSLAKTIIIMCLIILSQIIIWGIVFGLMWWVKNK